MKLQTNDTHQKSIISSTCHPIMDFLRSLMSLLIGISLCISLWHIMLQQEQYYAVSSSLNDTNFYYEAPSTFESNFMITVPTTNQLNILPKSDHEKLIDLDNFEYMMNPKTCKDLEQSPIVVVLVHSAPDNFHKRQTIRETWGKFDSRSMLLFLLGNVTNTTLQNWLYSENQMHGDMVLKFINF